MAGQTLSCQSGGLPHFQFETELDGATYAFEFRWNERAAGWYMSIYDSALNLQVGSVRVTVGFPLGAHSRYNTAAPPGLLVAFDTTNQDLDPGLDDLGERVQLVYYPAGG